MLSIEELEAALPSMAPWRAESPRNIDWQTLERELGTWLPSDYRSLAEAYPTLVVDDFLWIRLPNPGSEVAFAEGFQSGAEALRDLWEVGESMGYAPYPESGGLLIWGSSLSGDQLYWKVDSPDPDEWPVVVFGRNDDWSEFQGGVVKFLTDTFRRTIHVPGMPARFPSSHPRVHGV